MIGVFVQTNEGSSRAVRNPVGYVIEESGCWSWVGSLNYGYGQVYAAGRQQRAHRWMWETMIGPIPTGLEMDHLCRNRRCVNPAHLEPVTTRVNQLRGEGFSGKNARKTHCPKGHPFSNENTTIRKAGRWRACSRCLRESRLRLQARHHRERGVGMPYLYGWKNNPKRRELYGQRCRILASGKMSSVMVEFASGQREIVSRRALRKVIDAARVSPTREKGTEG